MYKSLVLPASLLSATIIGAGAFALPYVFSLAGLIAGLFYLLFFGAVFSLVHLMYADVIAATPENRRFSGYAGIYLGKFGFWSSVFMTMFGALLILTIYLVLSASFVKLIVPAVPSVYAVLFFWLFGSLAIFFNINRLAVSEFLIFAGMAAIIFTIFCFGLSGFQKIISAPLFDFNGIFLPFGAVLFSMYGRSAIPALLGYFRNNGQPLIKSKWPIVAGSVAPAFLYAVFVFGIFGLSDAVSEDAVSGLVGSLPKIILWILGIFGIICLWSTYIVIGRDVKKSLEHDFNAPLILSGAAVVISPILFYVIGFQDFLRLVEFAGAIIVGLEGIYIILMWLRASKINSVNGDKLIGRLNPAIIVLLFFVFLAGIIYAIIY